MITQATERYRRWEKRRAARFASWSVRRRWVTFVLVPVVVLCCCGTTVGVPVAWFLRATVDAGRGQASPDAAATVYLDALGYGREEGLLPLFDDEHQGELLAQWRAYRAAMVGTDPPPSRLTFGTLTVGPTRSGRAEVTVDVAAIWSGNGLDTGIQSERHSWSIVTRDDDGWRVSAVRAPVWCGGYVLAERCRTR